MGLVECLLVSLFTFSVLAGSTHNLFISGKCFYNV